MIEMTAVKTNLKEWNAVTRLTNGLQVELKKAQMISLKLWSIKAKQIAVDHLVNQDLPHTPLSQVTLNTKANAPYPYEILMETGKYRDSIKNWMIGDTAYAGVKDNVQYPKKHRNNGFDTVAEVAVVHEYGALSIGIPARPLWQPTLSELVNWQLVYNNPVDIFYKLIKSKYNLNDIQTISVITEAVR